MKNKLKLNLALLLANMVVAAGSSGDPVPKAPGVGVTVEQPYLQIQPDQVIRRLGIAGKPPKLLASILAPILPKQALISLIDRFLTDPMLTRERINKACKDLNIFDPVVLSGKGETVYVNKERKLAEGESIYCVGRGTICLFGPNDKLIGTFFRHSLTYEKLVSALSKAGISDVVMVTGFDDFLTENEIHDMRDEIHKAIRYLPAQINLVVSGGEPADQMKICEINYEGLIKYFKGKGVKDPRIEIGGQRIGSTWKPKEIVRALLESESPLITGIPKETVTLLSKKREKTFTAYSVWPRKIIAHSKLHFQKEDGYMPERLFVHQSGQEHRKAELTRNNVNELLTGSPIITAGEDDPAFNTLHAILSNIKVWQIKEKNLGHVLGVSNQLEVKTDITEATEMHSIVEKLNALRRAYNVGVATDGTLLSNTPGDVPFEMVQKFLEDMYMSIKLLSPHGFEPSISLDSRAYSLRFQQVTEDLVQFSFGNNHRIDVDSLVYFEVLLSKKYVHVMVSVINVPV